MRAACKYLADCTMQLVLETTQHCVELTPQTAKMATRGGKYGSYKQASTPIVGRVNPYQFEHSQMNTAREKVGYFTGNPLPLLRILMKQLDYSLPMGEVGLRAKVPLDKI